MHSSQTRQNLKSVFHFIDLLTQWVILPAPRPGTCLAPSQPRLSFKPLLAVNMFHILHQRRAYTNNFIVSTDGIAIGFGIIGATISLVSLLLAYWTYKAMTFENSKFYITFSFSLFNVLR